MPLVIVESKTKGEKIKSYLGAGWDVSPSWGHVSDLPVRELGVDLNTFQPTYELTERGAKTIATLKKLAKQNNGDVYLATDLDREGEAIAWHLSKLLGLKDAKRVTFGEITEAEIKRNIQNPRNINMQLVRGQECRRVLDRFVGYLPTLSIYSRFGKGNSAGRVQSIGLLAIVERDEAIENFKPTVHYNVFAHFELDGIPFKAEWIHPFKKNASAKDAESDHGDENNSKYLTNKVAAEKMANAVAMAPTFTLENYGTSEKLEKAPAPFTTTMMQQAAAKRFGWSAQETMKIAQALYEIGLITYHRTDSKDLSDEAIAQIRDFIANFQSTKGLNGFLPTQPNKFKGSANAQEAHEAIRPSNINDDGLTISDPQAKQLYLMIRTRTIASQIAPAKHLVTKAELIHVATNQPFSLSGKQTVFKGWRMFISDDTIDESADDISSLPNLSSVSTLNADTALAVEYVTKPPPHMKEPELISFLERKGIGRPSTAASIAAINLDRGYIEKDPKTKALKSTTKGREICHWLKAGFSFMTYTYSANMETGIDEVVSGDKTYSQFVGDVYRIVSTEVKRVNINDPGISSDDKGQIQRVEYKKDICPSCNNKTLTQYPSKKKPGAFFWGCSDRACKQDLMADVNGCPVPFEKKRNGT